MSVEYPDRVQRLAQGDASRDEPPTGRVPLAKGSFVTDLVEGCEVEAVFLVQRRSLRRTRDGRPFLLLLLGDRSGTIDGQVWEDAEAFKVPISERDFLRVRGVVERYRDRLQLKVAACAPCLWEDLCAEDFLPASGRPSDEMRAELRRWLRSIANPYLGALLRRFEADAGLMGAIMLAPAASTVHHDCLGGLLEHTLSLMSLADAVARAYAELDRDLLVTGAFLHDLGKVRELQALPGFPYTDEGQLVGHIVLGYEIAMRKIDSVPGFPADLRTQLGHLILSHQGEYEWGSPKRPKTLEAIVLHYLDNLDSKVGVYRKAAAVGEGIWTEYVRSLGRALYRGTGRGSAPQARGSPGRQAGERRDLVRDGADARRSGEAPGAPSPLPPPDLFGDGG